MSAGSNLSSNQDPRRENRIYRYTPVTNKPNQDPLPDYVSLLGMIFSMLGLMMRVSRNRSFVSLCSINFKISVNFSVFRQEYYLYMYIYSSYLYSTCV